MRNAFNNTTLLNTWYFVDFFPYLVLIKPADKGWRKYKETVAKPLREQRRLSRIEMKQMNSKGKFINVDHIVDIHYDLGVLLRHNIKQVYDLDGLKCELGDVIRFIEYSEDSPNCNWFGKVKYISPDEESCFIKFIDYEK